MKTLAYFKYLIVAAVLLFFHVFIAGTFTDVSASMEDTLLVGDSFIALKFWYGVRLPFTDKIIFEGHDPAPGDIMIFDYPIDPSQIYIKRCVAVGGQRVRIEEKNLFVDDIAIPLPPTAKNADPVLIPAGKSGDGKRDYFSEVAVPDTAVFVMGDNRDYSLDSRTWGFLSKKNIRGKVWMIVLSTDPDVSWFNIKRKIRWERMFKKVQ